MDQEIVGSPGQPTPNREELVQLGIKTAKSGNRQSALVIFEQVLSQDPRNERALLWMAYLATDKVEKRRNLMKVLKVNRNNQTARQELQRMARTEKARSNRTLIYGGLAIAAIILLIVVGVLFVVLLGSF